MTQPTRSMVHIDRALTNISVAFIQNSKNFVADKVFPVVPVQKQSDRYFVYLKEDWFRDEAEERAPGTESAGGKYEIDNTPTYFARKYAFHKDITEEDRANQDQPLNVDTDATEFVTQKMLLRRETLWAQKYFTPGGTAGAYISPWGTTLSGVASPGQGSVGAGKFVRWNDPASTPIQDISNGKLAISAVTGYQPNVLVLGARVYEMLKNHDEILSRIVFTQRGIVTADILAALFDVEKVVVGWAVRNVAPKGAQEDTDFLLGDHALLAYAAPRPGLKVPSAGYIFSWAGLLGAGAYGNRIMRIPVPLLGAGTERVEGEMAFDQKIVAADLGVFFAGAVNSD
jgi:hypothetical protein